MTETQPLVTVPQATMAELADSCRWVADAHLTRDPQEIAAALCDLYQLLACQGWAPAEKALTLLRLHTAAVDLALEQLVEP